MSLLTGIESPGGSVGYWHSIVPSAGVPSALEAPPLTTHNWRMSRGSEISGVCKGGKLPHD